MNFRIPALSAIAVLSCQAAIAGTTTSYVTTYSQPAIIFDTVNGIAQFAEDGPVADGVVTAGDSFFSSVATSPNVTTSGNVTTTVTNTLSIQFALSATNPGDAGSIGVYIFGDTGAGGVSGSSGAPTGTGVHVGTILDSALLDDSTVNSSAGPAASSVPLPRISFDTSLLPTTSNGEYWVLLEMANSSGDFYNNVYDNGLNPTGQVSASTYNYASTDPAYFPQPTDPLIVQPLSNQGLYAITIWNVTNTEVGTTTTTPDNPPTNVPEPASAVLLGAAIAGLSFARRRNAA